MAQLRGGVDELGGHLFQLASGSSGGHCLSEEHESLLGADAASLDYDEVVSHDTVVGEASHWGDVLLGQIHLGGCVVLDASSLALAHPVDLLVELASVEVAALTSSGD